MEKQKTQNERKAYIVWNREEGRWKMLGVFSNISRAYDMSLVKLVSYKVDGSLTYANEEPRSYPSVVRDIKKSRQAYVSNSLQMVQHVINETKESEHP